MRCFLTVVILLVATLETQAGPFRKRASNCQPCRQPASSPQFSRTQNYQYSSQQSLSQQGSNYQSTQSYQQSYQETQSYQSSNDALSEVNAARARRGLRPFIQDQGLTVGAQRAAQTRAERGLSGHLPNDFAMLPPGTRASAGGCAAWNPGMGWGACGTFENYTYAGAAWAMGRDGKRYMHIFYR